LCGNKIVTTKNWNIDSIIYKRTSKYKKKEDSVFANWLRQYSSSYDAVVAVVVVDFFFFDAVPAGTWVVSVCSIHCKI